MSPVEGRNEAVEGVPACDDDFVGSVQLCSSRACEAAFGRVNRYQAGDVAETILSPLVQCGHNRPARRLGHADEEHVLTQATSDEPQRSEHRY